MAIKSVIEKSAKKAKEKGAEFIDIVEKGAGIVANKSVETGKKIVEGINEKKMEIDRNNLRPVFKDDIKENTFDYPRMINICEEDDKHKNNVVCIDSIGHRSSPNDVDLLNIYKNNLKVYGVKLEPKKTDGLYYVNPFVPKTYVEMDEYFKYLQKEKANELLNIARDLGAKYVKIEISEKELNAEDFNAEADAKFGKNKGKAQINKKHKESRTLNVFADEELSGNDDPKIPMLVYFKDDKTIKDIIKQRFNDKNRLKSHTFKIDSSSSSLMKEKEALKVDGAIKTLKYSINESMAIGAERANTSYFSYTIKF